MNNQLKLAQNQLCVRVGAPFMGCDLNQKVGISRNVLDGVRPINGLRILPQGDTCGWYIWAGEEWSDAADFFLPIHVHHLEQWAPFVLPYLGLAPGWRFLITEEYEDIWQDPQLLGAK
jgi:hypothetical protein